MFPLIPLLSLIAILGGGFSLAWYSDMPKDKKEEADRIACGYAKQLFDKSVKELTKSEAQHVAQLTKRHFVN